MNIGYDAKRAFYNTSGLGNYSRSVILAIQEFYPQENLFLFTPEETPLFNRHATKLTVVTPDNFLSKTFPSLWRSLWMTKQIAEHGVQVYHGLSNELPLLISNPKHKTQNPKWIVTIHDLIFKRFPKYYSAIDRNIYDHKFKRSCVTADRIIAVSEQTKKDIIEFYKIAPEKIEVIYQSAGNYLRDNISEEEIKAARKKFNLPQEYILSVGTIEERKNLLLVLKALAALKSGMTIPLVVVGKPTSYKQELLKFLSKKKLTNTVVFLENISTEDLQPIYAGASLFVYPSRFEGFGIPVVEALHYSVPVIAAKGSCLEEAGGPSSIYVHPDNEDEMANAIATVLADSSLQERMKGEGKVFSKKFSQKGLASSLMKCYSSLQ